MKVDKYRGEKNLSSETDGRSCVAVSPHYLRFAVALDILTGHSYQRADDIPAHWRYPGKSRQAAAPRHIE